METTKRFMRIDVAVWDNRGEKLTFRMDREMKAEDLIKEFTTFLIGVTMPEDWIKVEKVVVRSNDEQAQARSQALAKEKEAPDHRGPSDND